MSHNLTFQVDPLREWAEGTVSGHFADSPTPPLPREITDTALVLLDVATEFDDDEGWATTSATLHGPEGACAAGAFLLDARVKPLPLLTAIEGDADLVADDLELTVCPDCLPTSAGLAHVVPIAAALETAGQWYMEVGELLHRPVQNLAQHCSELLMCRLHLDFPADPTTGSALPALHPDHPGDGTDFGPLTHWWRELRTWWSHQLQAQLDALRAQQAGWDGPLVLVTSKRECGSTLRAFSGGTDREERPTNLLPVLTVAPVAGMVRWDNGDPHTVMAVPSGTDLTDGGALDTWVRLGPAQPGDDLKPLLHALPTLFTPTPESQQDVDAIVAAFSAALDGGPHRR